MEADDAREEVREEPGGVAQEGVLALDAARLLEEREGQDLRVREALEALVASRAVWVEEAVGVVHEAEEYGDEGPFRCVGPSGKVLVGHPGLL